MKSGTGEESETLPRKVAYGIVIFLFLMAFIFYKVNNTYVAAYSVEVDDKVLAVVKEKSDFIDVLKKMRDEALSLHGQKIELNKEPDFIEIRARKKELTQYEEIIKNIKAQLDIKLRAAAIGINGKKIVTVKDDETAHRILNNIKNSFTDGREFEYDYVGFVEKVEVMETAVDFGDIMDEEEALRFIVVGTDEEKIHKIKKGENTWSIALEYGLKMDDIMKANPGIEPTRLQIGQEISLMVPEPLVSVKTKEYVELVEEVPFETEYEKTNTLYKGDKKIIVHGEEGKREVKGYIVEKNGTEIGREVVEERILSEPKTRVIAEGTKPRPATMATGFFANPTRGRLTSSFGMRWGKQHTGIDIASPRGTPIFAADAGKVSFSGWKGTYGNLVIIDHENGYQTYYAHNNRNLVKQGQRVYKGQKIAEMGSTGRSTGVHLHFEVRKNGTPINPRNFVKY
ncbi:MAG TPA: M23 family metallopeptidase [Clostridia bacterium]|nr:M23 family metallopeptidase [Clostridia bacterium]